MAATGSTMDNRSVGDHRAEAGQRQTRAPGQDKITSAEQRGQIDL
jgi:hypothetical protein